MCFFVDGTDFTQYSTRDQSQGPLGAYQNVIEKPRPDVTTLDILPSSTFASDSTFNDLPKLPSDARSRDLVDTVYFYTQARYCIIDWARLREWHQDRVNIAYTASDGPIESQIGAQLHNLRRLAKLTLC